MENNLRSICSDVYLTPYNYLRVKDEPVTPLEGNSRSISDCVSQTQEDFRNKEERVTAVTPLQKGTSDHNSEIYLTPDVYLHNSEIYLTPDVYLQNSEIYLTPVNQDERIGDYNVIDCGGLRKSMSLSDLTELHKETLVTEKLFKGNMSTNCCTNFGDNFMEKFVSMAEAICCQYYADTQFLHSNQSQMLKLQGEHSLTGPITPQSPVLELKPQKQKKKLVSENSKKLIKKSQHSTTASLEDLVHHNEISKKAIMAHKSVKLSKVLNKKAPLSNTKQKIISRPFPKYILDKLQIPVKPEMQLTKPVSTNFHIEKANPINDIKNDVTFKVKSAKPEINQHFQIGPVKPAIENQDEIFYDCEGEIINQQMKEEKKQVRSTKAVYIPTAVNKCKNDFYQCGSSSSTKNNENFKPVLKLKSKLPCAITSVKQVTAKEHNEQGKGEVGKQKRLRQQLKKKKA